MNIYGVKGWVCDEVFDTVHHIAAFNPFPNKPWFLRVCGTSLLKTLWKKEKSLVRSNFSFSRSVFIYFENFLSLSSNLKLSSANSFCLEEPKICRLGKCLTHFSEVLFIHKILLRCLIFVVFNE